MKLCIFAFGEQISVQSGTTSSFAEKEQSDFDTLLLELRYPASGYEDFRGVLMFEMFVVRSKHDVICHNS